jgi:hypothetical protein
MGQKDNYSLIFDWFFDLTQRLYSLELSETVRDLLLKKLDEEEVESKKKA